MANIKNYFDLGLFPEEPGRPQFGSEDKSRLSGKRTVWTILLYAAVAGGVLASYLIDPFKKQSPAIEPIDIPRIVYSLVIAALIYPAVYKMAKFDRKPNLMQLFVAFQCGFFWDVLVDIIKTKLSNAVIIP